jgi:CrcB protein
MKRALSFLSIGVGGAFGASCRWAANELIGPQSFPWATLLVNVVGCALLAAVTWSAWSRDLKAAAGVGFCGGLTTFSTFAVEVVRLFDDGRAGAALVYGAVSVAAGLAAFIAVRMLTSPVTER